MVTELPFVSIKLQDLVQTETFVSEHPGNEATKENKEYISGQVFFLHDRGNTLFC